MFLQKDSWKDAHLCFESSSSTFSNNNKKSIVLPSKNAERNTKKTQKITIMQKLLFCKNTDDGVIVGLFSEKCLQKHKTIIKKEKEIHFHKKHALSQMIHCPLTLSEHYWRDFKTRALNSVRPRTVYVV